MNEGLADKLDVCVFCLTCRGNVGPTCTYGLAHEFPTAVRRPTQERKVDKKLCSKCGLHPKNPKFDTNGCVHEYPS